MQVNLVINPASKTPVYKQLLEQLESGIRSGRIKDGELLPSMNDLSASLDISKETVKKVYIILRDNGLLNSQQGKGFYVQAPRNGFKPNVLLIFDKLSTYKQEMYDAFAAKVGNKVSSTILLHNQSVDLLEYYVDKTLGRYDYFIVTPHFPLDSQSQQRVAKILSRIPNRQLILADRQIESMKGNFGTVYQDFDNDIEAGLEPYINEIKKYRFLHVITMQDSLYGPRISMSLERFCERHSINHSSSNGIPAEVIEKGGLYLVLNSQAENNLVKLYRISKEKGLKVGSDIGLITYNESPLLEMMFDGVTSVSTDFHEMGTICGEMILDKALRKVHCNFRMTRRNSF